MSASLATACTALAGALACHNPAQQSAASGVVVLPPGLKVARALAEASGLPELAAPGNTLQGAGSPPTAPPCGPSTPRRRHSAEALAPGAVPGVLPPSVLQALGPSPPGPVREAAQKAWATLGRALELGLLVGVRLALGALLLQGQVEAAQGEGAGG